MATDQAHEDGHEEEQLEEGGANSFLVFNATPSVLVSLVVHMVGFLILGLLTFGPPPDQWKNVLEIGQNEDIEEIEELEEEIMEPVDVETEVTMDLPESMVTQEEVVEVVEEMSVSTDIDSAAIAIELSDFGETTAPKNDLMREIGSVSGSGLEGRGAAARGKLVAKNGGSEGSEAAVALALKWLAAHQMPDGGWNFDHRPGQCGGRCNHHGSLGDKARSGATAMALLPFLGAGQTHKEGKYKEVVGRGLYFMVSQMKQNGGLNDAGGRMYSHGLCAITLTEAYAMTHDKGLMGPAQMSVNFISYAQDPVGGGWRYTPKQAGDTSVVGWQLMALKSAHMAYLQVDPNTIRGATKFLDSVQADSGASYGYTTPGAGSATTAVGLLCRMYLGWKKDEPALERGVQKLSASGPSKGNMYYNYYATQVMRQFGGDYWKKWNSEMRDYLVNSQAKNGHMTGSWFFEGGGHGAEAGGRIYATSLATMILEVYYRHMPIYGKQAAEEDFPL